MYNAYIYTYTNIKERTEDNTIKYSIKQDKGTY